MPKIEFNFADAESKRMIKAFANAYNYQSKITGAEGQEIDNPQSKADFTKDKIMQYIKDVVRANEADEARKAVQMPTDINIT